MEEAFYVRGLVLANEESLYSIVAACLTNMQDCVYHMQIIIISTTLLTLLSGLQLSFYLCYDNLAHALPAL